jgi:hypothetical protein
MKTQSIVRGSVVAVVMLVSSTAIGRASEDRQHDASGGNGRVIVGSWAETTSIPGGPPFAGLLTVGGDGTLVSSYQGAVITAPPLPASYTPVHGQWVHERGRTFTTTSLGLVSDFNGNLLFVLKLKQRITLNKLGDRYHSIVRAEFSDPAGNLAFALDGTSEGQRIKVEPLH